MSLEATRQALASHCGCTAVVTALGATCWPLGPMGPVVTVDPDRRTVTATTTCQRIVVPYRHPAQACQLASRVWACDAAISIAAAADQLGGTVETYGADADSPAAARIYGWSVFCRIYQHLDSSISVSIEARRPDGQTVIIWDSADGRTMPDGIGLAAALTQEAGLDA